MTSPRIGELPALSEAMAGELRGVVQGELVLPGDAAYDEARRVWNGMIDRRPAAVVRCAVTADVAAAVNFARRRGLVIAVPPGSDTVLLPSSHSRDEIARYGRHSRCRGQ